MRQLSLLDLEPSSSGPTPKIEMDWLLFGRSHFERLIREFEREYGETPVFWRRVGTEADIFQLSPYRHLVVDLETGRLRDSQPYLQYVWEPRPGKFQLERRRFISKQVAGVLDGTRQPSTWREEVMEEIRYVIEREEELWVFLRDCGLKECVNLGPHDRKVRLFAEPSQLKRVYLDGCAAGYFL